MSDFNKPKVEWMRVKQLTGGGTVGVSSKTGILSIKGITTGPVNGFADEIEHLYQALTEVRQYIKDNEDICNTKEARVQNRKNQSAVLKLERSLRMLGFSDDKIVDMLKAAGQ